MDCEKCGKELRYTIVVTDPRTNKGHCEYHECECTKVEEPEEAKPRLDITVRLTGEDSNVFNLSGIITQAMSRNGHGELVSEFITELWDCESYQEALSTFRKWVHVT